MIVIALVSLTGYLFVKTSTELAPEEDRGALFSLITAPRYATTDYTQLYVDSMRDKTKDLPELKANFSIAGFGGQTNSGIAVWSFKDWSERDRSQKELQGDIQARLSSVTGVQALVFAPPSLPGAGGGLPISVIIQSTGDPSQVYEVAEGNPPEGAGFGPIHRRPELARLRRTAGDGLGRPRCARRR